jgi:hypothetical protein
MLIGLSFTQAQSDLSDFLDSLLEDVKFGYTNEKITVTNITPTSITLSSPVVMDNVGDPVLSYTVMYWPVPLADVQGNDVAILDQYQEKLFTFPSVQSTISMTLSTADQLDPSKIYYVTIVPRNIQGEMWEISPTEVCFRLSDQIYGEGKECSNDEDQSVDTVEQQTQQHSAAPNLSLANITHTIQGDTITLRWITLPGVDEIEIFLLNADGQTFTKLTTTRMSTQQYSFTTSQQAPLRVRFIALDDDGNQFGNEVIYTINDYQIAPPSSPDPIPTPPSVADVPQVGPIENTLAAILAAFLVYFVYKLLRKSDK